MSEQEYPTGWDEEQVKKVLIHYESQTEDEAVEEDERLAEDAAQALIQVPAALVPVIREMVAEYEARVKS